jgi:hypothetical protein
MENLSLIAHVPSNIAIYMLNKIELLGHSAVQARVEALRHAESHIANGQIRP